VVDIWQADSDGLYDMNMTKTEQAAYRLRGKVRTGERGGFRVETIRPAPAHIHFMITASGRPSLVTELFFEGDPYLGNDPASQVHPDLVHALTLRDEGLVLEPEFVLES